jgi:hypothetical protein
MVRKSSLVENRIAAKYDQSRHLGKGKELVPSLFGGERRERMLIYTYASTLIVAQMHCYH